MKFNLRTLTLATFVTAISCSNNYKNIEVGEGSLWRARGDWTNFTLKGEALTENGSEAALLFHSDGSSGYEVLLHNGPIDGSRKTGSLSAVRNLYRSLEEDGQWFDFELSVRGKNISISIGGVPVVCYTEPANPWRSEEYSSRTLSNGAIYLKGLKGKTRLRNVSISTLPEDIVQKDIAQINSLPPVDEQNDSIIRLQQRNFPVIDWHVHLKGGLTKEQAHAMSMNYGINYGVAPNAGEGGVGRMLADDNEVYEYLNEVKDLPFLRGVQGEGRRWTVTFSQEALGSFDYLFTDAMTIVDHKGRVSRIYRPEEVKREGLSMQQYMDLIVDQTVKILTNEPADIYANATYIPEADMYDDYDSYWTPERVDKVIDVLVKYKIAMEINPRYRIPSFEVIRRAKARGVKFTFGTNNVDADFGRLEYCIQAIKECGLEASDIWFPVYSIRSSRTPVNYNNF